MCGIVGIFAYGPRQSVDPRELLRIRDHMSARGPDGDGTWLSEDERIGFGHRRLEIIGLGEQGAQPMVLDYCQRSVSEGLVITFNGEIYNHRELRSRLESKGHVFKSSCDTEVLLHLYEEYRDDLVDHLRGMYAFGCSGAATPLCPRLLRYQTALLRRRRWHVPLRPQARALLSGGAIPSTVDEGAARRLLRPRKCPGASKRLGRLSAPCRQVLR